MNSKIMKSYRIRPGERGGGGGGGGGANRVLKPFVSLSSPQFQNMFGLKYLFILNFNAVLLLDRSSPDFLNKQASVSAYPVCAGYSCDVSQQTGRENAYLRHDIRLIIRCLCWKLFVLKRKMEKAYQVNCK